MQQINLAGCIIRDGEGGILLLHRNTTKRRQWEIPGGKLGPNEDARETAIREVREEVGVNVELVRELGSRSFHEDGHTMNYTWFLANIISGTPTPREPATHDRCDFFSINQLKEMSAELSPNTQNFLAELANRRITL